MYRTFLLAVVAAGLITACTTVQQTPAAQPLPPPAFPAAAELGSEVVVAPILPAFICPDGLRVELDHDEKAGVLNVKRGDESWVLQQQVSPAGRQRFVQDEDTLERFDGEIHMRRGRSTRQICPAIPAGPAQGTLWGMLDKRDRMALPPGSVAKILLVDAARADAPAIEIASVTISTTGNQTPLYFLLRYDAGQLIPRAQTYRLQARLSLPDGQLGWITDTASFVLESEAPPPPVELLLTRVGPPAE